MSGLCPKYMLIEFHSLMLSANEEQSMTINFRKNNYLQRFIRVAVLLLITMLFTQFSYADRSNEKTPQPEGFVLKKVNSHYEPVLHYDETVTIPGTNIKVGEYSYVLSNGDEVPKLGFLIDNDQFYYVKEESVACSHSDANYGVFDHFFLVDGYAYGASHNRTMYLFKYTTHSVVLLDIISQAWVNQNGIDFATAYPGEVKYGFLGSNPPTIWTPISDIDKDGNPEINLIIFLDDQVIELYLEIFNEKLKVDLNPNLYKSLYEKDKATYKNGKKPISYFFYGYLSKNLNLNQIKKAMKSGDIPYQAVDLIENTTKWNAAFHDDNQNFELIKYELNGK
jgi:hypothetical protein